MGRNANNKGFESPYSNMGRPPKPINWKKFNEMCAEQCTKIDICLEFGVDPSTLEDKIRDKFNMTFSALFEIRRTKGIRSLRSLQYEQAMAGDRAMGKHVYGLYSHKDPNINPQIYGGDPVPRDSDQKIDINVSFTEKSEKSNEESLEIEKIKDEN